MDLLTEDLKSPIQTPGTIRRIWSFYYCALERMLPSDLVLGILSLSYQMLKKTAPKSLREFNVQMIPPEPCLGFSTYIGHLKVSPSRKYLLKTRDVDKREARHPSFTQLFDQPVHALLFDQASQCPFVDTLYCSFSDIEGKQIVHVFKYVQTQPLLVDQKCYTEDQARFYIAELICGIEFFHSRNQVGLFDNIADMVLLAEDGHLILSFLKSWIPESDYLREQRLNFASRCSPPHLPIRTQDLSPEALRSDSIPAQDFWGLGLTLFFLLTGRHCWGSVNEIHPMRMYCLILSGDPLASLKETTLSNDVKSLLQQLLQKDSNARLTNFSELKAHAWFNSIDWNHLSRKEVEPPDTILAPKESFIKLA